MEQWNNVELADLSKKSYTLNHAFNMANKNYANGSSANENNNSSEVDSNTSAPTNGVDLNNKAKCEGHVLQPGSDIKPKCSNDEVEALVRRLYGITISSMREFVSYDDRNYWIQEDRNIKNPIIPTHWPHGYVLKILNALDSKKVDFIEAQNELMIYISKHNIQCPKPILNVVGKYYSIENLQGQNHIVRLLEFLPGKIFHEVETTNYLLYQSGEYIANFDRAVRNFNHDAYDSHQSLWMLQAVPKLRDFLYALQDHSRKAIIEEIIEGFEQNVLSKLGEFETQIIHGDFNEQNIIVDRPKGSLANDEYRVVGILDFGDTSKSPVLFEIGIALTYMMLQAKSLERGGIFLAGYNSIRPISRAESVALKYCVAARLAQSLVMGAYTHSLNPSNEYVLVTQEQGWKMIQQLWREDFDRVDEIWKEAADKYLTQSVK